MRALKLIAAAAFMATALSGVSAQEDTPAQTFTTAAANSDMFEIRSSEAALQKAQSTQVREFAQAMINDHTKASRELAAAAGTAGTAVPAEPDARHAGMIQAIETGPDGTFDRNYLDAQLDAHREALALMTTYAQSGEDPALRAHAQKTAPVIQMHLDHAQKLNQGM